jgi:uncharacterized repeat protein (TIGR01451 family)
MRHIDMMIVILVAVFAGVTPTWAATNQATDPGGGSISLTGSGLVTVNSTALQLVKQVWSTAGACLASSPTDTTCNGGLTTATVAAGTQLKFVIFVKNTTAFALTDVRFQDVLDTSATGFTYVAVSIKHDATLTDAATSAQIYTQVDTSGTVDTDAVDTGAGNYASITGAPLSNLTVGAVVGQVNATLNVAANKTFALEFQVIKK